MNDIEELIRDTMAGRAETVTSGPGWTPADARAATEHSEVLDLIAPPASRARRSWRGPAALLAAAAVVAGAVAGVVIDARRVPHGVNRAADSTANKPAPVVTRAACRTSPPGTWRETARAATVPVRDGSSALESSVFRGTTSDGEAVIEYNEVGDDQPHSITDRVGLASLGSPQIHEIARVTTFTHGLALTVSIDQNLVVIAVEEGINHAARHSRILAFDAQTGLLRTVANVPESAREQLTGAASPFAGQVYWETTTGRGPGSDRIRALDMATGHRTVVARGIFDLESSAAGLSWALTPWRLNRPASLPPAVRAQVNELSYNSFVTDGESYAWQTSDGAIDWWNPSTGQIVRVPKLLARPFSRAEPGSVFAVAGPIVIYQPPHSDAQRVLDVRTGATAPISSQSTAQGRLGQLVGDPIEAVSVGGRLMRLDTSTLPTLQC
jgi:hypothetical protein